MGNDFRRRLGVLGEATATRFISEAGLQVVDRNWRNGRAGELDIIATDGLNMQRGVRSNQLMIERSGNYVRCRLLGRDYMSAVGTCALTLLRSLSIRECA